MIPTADPAKPTFTPVPPEHTEPPPVIATVAGDERIVIVATPVIVLTQPLDASVALIV
jgi:hypothetical protein